MATIRILQIHEHNADLETTRGVEGLSRALGEGFAVQTRTLGPGGDWRDVPTAAASARRLRENFDIVHAWGGRALTVAALGLRTPIVYSPDPQTRRRSIGWLRAVMSYRDVQVACGSATLRRKLVERGIALDRCHLIRPGVEFSRIGKRKDADLRARLNLTDDDHVLLAPGESTLAAGHEYALWAATVLYVAYPKFKLLFWGRGDSIGRIRRFSKSMGVFTSTRFASDHLGQDVEFETLLSAADSVLVTAAGPVPTLPIASCMAAALPIVATTSYTVGELLEDRHNALMCGRNDARLNALRVLDLLKDSSLQWKISDMARTEAYEFFAFTRFVNQFRGVYRQIAAKEKVVIPDEPAGAGLRFHGLA